MGLPEEPEEGFELGRFIGLDVGLELGLLLEQSPRTACGVWTLQVVVGAQFDEARHVALTLKIISSLMTSMGRPPSPNLEGVNLYKCGGTRVPSVNVPIHNIISCQS